MSFAKSLRTLFYRTPLIAASVLTDKHLLRYILKTIEKCENTYFEKIFFLNNDLEATNIIRLKKGEEL